MSFALAAVDKSIVEVAEPNTLFVNDDGKVNAYDIQLLIDVITLSFELKEHNRQH